MLQIALEAALTAEQKKKGFRLEESINETVTLRYQGHVVGCFSRAGVTIARIRQVADKVEENLLTEFE